MVGFGVASFRIAELAPSALGEAQHVVDRACPFDPAGRVAEEKLFGPSPHAGPSVALGAYTGESLLCGVAAQVGRFLRLLAVLPERRGSGIGSALLAACEDRAHRAGERCLRTLDQPGNYLAPGIDLRNAETIAWFERRGFRAVAWNENLRVPLLDNPLVTAARQAELCARCEAAGFRVGRAGLAQSADLTAWVGTRFSRSWAFEVERALTCEPPAVHVAWTAAREIAAFAAHDGNNRGLGWFGPAGTALEHRGRGLGAALLLPCLLDIRAAGHTQATIAWIGPREFYARTAGAEDDRRFVVLQKELGAS